MTETRVMRKCTERAWQGDLGTRVTVSACGLVVDRMGLVVSTTALGSLLSVVSTPALHDGSPIVAATALSVVAAAAFLGSSACWGVVAASTHCHLEDDCWEKIQ